MLSVVMLSVIMLNVTYKPFVLSAIMLIVVRLNVVMLSVVAPSTPAFTCKFTRAIITLPSYHAQACYFFPVTMALLVLGRSSEEQFTWAI
jgi:hypothetical protein